MLKKNIRQRKEYLFKKNEEIKNKLIFEKTQKIKYAVDSNNFINLFLTIIKVINFFTIISIF